MKKFHIAISTNQIAETIEDYSTRLGMPPCCVVEGEYALWRTESLNVSVRQDDNYQPGTMRHLGWEDSDAQEFTQDTDVNEIVWERFSAQAQADEINSLWPDVGYDPSAD